MRKTTIVMTYINRQIQLNKTLESISKTKHDNFNVVIIDDGSDEEIKTNNFNFPVTIRKTENKQWTNPEPAYNLGFIEALKSNPEIIINQNAECYHNGDILMYAEENLTDKNYITFGCFSISEENTFKEHDIKTIIQENNICATRDNGENAWYNHSIHRPVALEFCSAITTRNLIAINGYDERLANGIGYGDEYLKQRIAMSGITVEIIDSPFAVHQWHKRSQEPVNKAELCEKNRLLLNELMALKTPRAIHKYTPDL
jgi:glycosyltransferase involved in cell wall biosynthesis